MDTSICKWTRFTLQAFLMSASWWLAAYSHYHHPIASRAGIFRKTRNALLFCIPTHIWDLVQRLSTGAVARLFFQSRSYGTFWINVDQKTENLASLTAAVHGLTACVDGNTQQSKPKLLLSINTTRLCYPTYKGFRSFFHDFYPFNCVNVFLHFLSPSFSPAIKNTENHIKNTYPRPSSSSLNAYKQWKVTWTSLRLRKRVCMRMSLT